MDKMKTGCGRQPVRSPRIGYAASHVNRLQSGPTQTGITPLILHPFTSLG